MGRHYEHKALADSGTRTNAFLNNHFLFQHMKIGGSKSIAGAYNGCRAAVVFNNACSHVGSKMSSCRGRNGREGKPCQGKPLGHTPSAVSMRGESSILSNFFFFPPDLFCK